MRLTLLATMLVAAGCSGNGRQPDKPNRIEEVEQQVEAQRKASADAIEGYVPKTAGRIDDLTAPAVPLLHQLPGVVDVEVLVSAPNPTHRIIHLRDWHFVPRDLFAADVRQAAGKPLSDEEAHILYREHLLEVELVQLEQASVLRCLVKHHGLGRVLAEGLTPQGLPAYHEVIAALRGTDERLAALQKDRAGLKTPAPDIDKAIEELVVANRRQLLEYGAVGQLAVAKEIEALPLDEEEALANAKPVGPDGRAAVDAERREAQVRAALEHGPCAVIGLGGANDLSESVRRLGGGTTEYVRVTTVRFKERSWPQ